ncbi:DNA polymerase [Pseudomonas phage PspYZU05]|uniref:DNA-directed DNA polymerase n=1 Tax=Pseudomonas phage PspYZU05 TaxID=1983556 RepID=A0A2U7NJH8_9CAUD|nr:DNA polymerase [Pseudomonas phage PspYZU05]ASD52034.1 hypothetical protein PspYZU05_82 [Pseudomonas phage PspYZU05]
MKFYLTVDQKGSSIIERYIEDGVERIKETEYEPSLFIHSNVPTEYKDIYGKYVTKRKFSSMREASDYSKRNQDVGVETLGMDDYKLAYLSDEYRAFIDYDESMIRICNVDIETTSPIGFPDPKAALHPIDAITHYDSIDDKFYVFDLLHSPYGNVTEWSIDKARLPESEGGDEVPESILERVVYMPFYDEQELLLEYLNLLNEKPPVVFTGWNIEGFDIPYIYQRIENVLGRSTALRMSPIGSVRTKLVTTQYGEERLQIILGGISVLDYMELYKKFSFTNQPSYSLDYIAEAELGVGKLEYEGPISKLRVNNHQRYISYNIIDVERVRQIDDKRNFITLSLSIAYYSKMQIQSVFSPIKTWDAIIFNSLREDNLVIPENKSHVVQSYPGAYVKEPVPAAYKYVISCDLTSLYPSIIRQVNISPDTLVGSFAVHPILDYVNKVAPRPSDIYSCSPSGYMYDKTKVGVIPAEVTKVFNQRKDWKKKMLASKRNTECIKRAMQENTNTDYGMNKVLDFNVDFNEETLELLNLLSISELQQLEKAAKKNTVKCDTNQINRKLLINSLYGGLGNVWFRYYDLRNATSITLFGQCAIQWIERKINEYLNGVVGTTNHKYVIYGDTDSVYICIDPLVNKVGEHKFRDTNHLVDFLDKFAAEKLEPAIDTAYREMCEYFNNKEHLMFMDREAIAGPPLGSKGLGGLWTGKKRYALNVWDMEGTRFASPELKIMGLETQKSSTPKACQVALKECIRRMLQEGEASLQEHFKSFEKEFRELEYKSISAVSSANNIAKYDVDGFPGYKCPYHIRGILTYHRAINGTYAPRIADGDKVMVLPLRDQNPFNDLCIAWPSGSDIDPSIRQNVLDWIDYSKLFEKTFVKPLAALTEACKIDYEKRGSLLDIFDF